MRLGYFTMPLHPMGRNCTETLAEDRESIILAEKLGFYDAFVGEHLTELTENIVCSIATWRSRRTRPIRIPCSPRITSPISW